MIAGLTIAAVGVKSALDQEADPGFVRTVTHLVLQSISPGRERGANSAENPPGSPATIPESSPHTTTSATSTLLATSGHGPSTLVGQVVVVRRCLCTDCRPKLAQEIAGDVNPGQAAGGAGQRKRCGPGASAALSTKLGRAIQDATR